MKYNQPNISANIVNSLQKSKPDKIRQNRTKQDKTRQNRTSTLWPVVILHWNF